MTITIIKHEEDWTAEIDAGDQIQIYFNGNPLPETLVTIPTGNTGNIYFRYNIKLNGI